MENFFINEYDSFYNGHNLTFGGEETTGYKHTQKAKEKLSKIHKEKTISKEQKIRISETSKGRKHSKETIEKIRNSSLKRKHSTETKNKMSQSRKGRKFTTEWREKITKSISKKICVNGIIYNSKKRSFRKNPIYLYLYLIDG